MAHWQVAIRYMDMYRDDPTVHLAGVFGSGIDVTPGLHRAKHRNLTKVIATPSISWMVAKCAPAQPKASVVPLRVVLAFGVRCQTPSKPYL
ncbi:uncharacterized protein TRAVEDRAFT_32014 [Trametes versicolor FP-101664 SS1]|uniref:uncharacterized protein n=1 Tax=Trametes versicolor (strain FP-101664) TaxID=717944 RepID=UPI000462412C|nr:uncharacterized protein TRAVEDRAFT_32014 [Trametes versicolor FP-101664 SS1]EIW53146.1 hypothetical protein TRAVEDRAFT_32014 [Trametes versicolor FP-101664 SS1]